MVGPIGRSCIIRRIEQKVWDPSLVRSNTESVTLPDKESAILLDKKLVIRSEEELITRSKRGIVRLKIKTSPTSSA